MKRRSFLGVLASVPILGVLAARFESKHVAPLFRVVIWNADGDQCGEQLVAFKPHTVAVDGWNNQQSGFNSLKRAIFKREKDGSLHAAVDFPEFTRYVGVISGYGVHRDGEYVQSGSVDPRIVTGAGVVARLLLTLEKA